MESFDPLGKDVPMRPVSQIADIVREYESRADRPKGHVVSRYVAEAEPAVLETIALSTGLTTSELWSFIKDVERKAARPFADEAPTIEPKHKSKLKRLESDDESTVSGKLIDATDESTDVDGALDD